MMVPLSLSLVPAFWSRLPALERVLSQRIAPIDGFERCLRQAMRRLLRGWLLLSLPLAIEAALLTDLTAPIVFAGPAWLALTLLCSLWAFAAWHGWIATGWMLPLAPLLLLSLFGHTSLWQAWRELGWPVHLAACLLLPLSLWRLKYQLAQGHKRTQSPAQHLGAWLSRTLRRGQQLDGANNSYWLMLFVLLMQFAPPLLAGSASGSFLVAEWGKPLGFAHLASLLFMSTWLVSTLRSRDLHWRRLLAPPGRFRSGLALRLAADNWLPIAGSVMLLSLLGVASQILIFNRSLGPALLGNLAVALPLLCDFSLALMLALLLRGRLTQNWFGGLFAMTIGMGGVLWVLLGASFWQASTAWLSRGWLSQAAGTGRRGPAVPRRPSRLGPQRST